MPGGEPFLLRDPPPPERAVLLPPFGRVCRGGGGDGGEEGQGGGGGQGGAGEGGEGGGGGAQGKVMWKNYVTYTGIPSGVDTLFLEAYSSFKRCLFWIPY